jgi:hypothetical protein
VRSFVYLPGDNFFLRVPVGRRCLGICTVEYFCSLLPVRVVPGALLGHILVRVALVSIDDPVSWNV